MFYDIRKARGTTESIVLENDNININSSPFSYAGARYFDKGIGFASDNVYSDSLLDKARKLSKLSEFKADFPETKGFRQKVKPVFKQDPADIDLSEKIRLAKKIHSMLESEHVSYRNVVLKFISGKKHYEDSSGSEIEKPMNYILVYAKISGGKDLQTAYFSLGTRKGYEFLREYDFASRTRKLVKRHEKMLTAKKAPAGRQKVILDPILTGVFFHEAVGHACEADAVLNNASVLKQKINKKIASEVVSLSDNPKINGFGSYNYDDEGIKAGNTLMIKNGILVGYLHSKETAARMNKDVTGNGRSQNPSYLPIPRMSNTVVHKGDSSLEEMKQEVKNGLFLIGSKGGVVEPATGNFLFNAEYGYVIENGEEKEMVSDVSLSGNVLDILKKIKLAGKKSFIIPRTGFCGKRGQSIPVDEKAPHLMISEAIVGGH